MLGIVATHGRDNPFGNKVGMGRQFEEGVRAGLDRAGADYAMTIPYGFAFYGDLWRPDGDDEWRVDNKDLDAPDADSLGAAIADELLASAGLIDQGDKGFWDSLTGVIGTVQGRLPSRLAKTMLEHFAGDTAEYFAYEKLRELAIDRLVKEIKQVASQPDIDGVVLLAHSMGTIVAYDLCVQHPDLPVRGFISFGSPLGFEVILQSEGADFAAGIGTAPFPSALPHWTNIYNKEDLVASVHELASRYVSQDARVVEDVDTGKMQSPGITRLFQGHDPGNYLTSMAMGKAIRSVVEGDQ